MQRAVKIGTTLRNNWKKSIFFSLASAYGVKWYMKKLADEEYMRTLAKEALTYGTGTQGVQAPNYSVTVILNPLASGGKGRKLYEKYCAPLLHLAGIKVSVMRTEEQGQAKDIMKIMKDADAVLVAGGDGSLLETVTGLLRRPDAPTLAKTLPIGVLPVGRTNSLAKRLLEEVGDGEDQVRLMGEATMAVIRQLRRGVGVLELENQGEERRGQKVFGLSHVKLGTFTDAQRREGSYWLTGPLKRYLAYAGTYLTGHKKVAWSCDLGLQYAQLVEAQATQESTKPTETRGQAQSGLLSWLGGSSSSSSSNLATGPQAERVWVSWPDRFRGSQIDIEPEADNDGLIVKLFRGNLSFSEFASHGAHRVGSGLGQSLEAEEIKSPSIVLTPGEEERVFDVDGEGIEFQDPVQITYLKDSILMFCNTRPSDGDRPETRSTPTPGRWSMASNFAARKYV